MHCTESALGKVSLPLKGMLCPIARWCMCSLTVVPRKGMPWAQFVILDIDREEIIWAR